MGFPLSAQAQGFFSSLLLGFSLALIYDLLRALRLSRRGLALLTPLCDALYCALFALLVFLFSLRAAGGELRLYMIVSALCGALFYFLVCARFFRPLWALWAEVLLALLSLLTAPLRALKMLYGKLAKLCKRYFLFSKKWLIIKAYERRALHLIRRRRKKGGEQHGKRDQATEKAHESADDARHRDFDRACGRAARPPQRADRAGKRRADGPEK